MLGMLWTVHNIPNIYMFLTFIHIICINVKYIPANMFSPNKAEIQNSAGMKLILDHKDNQ